MCNNFPNIKVVKGNAFALLMPLKKRTFESCEPIDEDIDATQLTDFVVKFGGVQYPASTSEDGVQIIIPADIAVGTYSIVLTAMYQGSAIRAAYESAVTIVDYNSQSDAQQYIAGSPIVLDAAYVIGGTLTDAELEALKEEYREKNAQLQQAIEDAEAAKAEWEQKAADLDGVAQESTSQEILTAVENIDFSSVAKQGTNPNANISDIQAEVDAISPDIILGKQQLAAAITARGVTTASTDPLSIMADKVVNIPNVTKEFVQTNFIKQWMGEDTIDGLEMIEQYYSPARPTAQCYVYIGRHTLNIPTGAGMLIYYDTDGNLQQIPNGSGQITIGTAPNSRYSFVLMQYANRTITTIPVSQTDYLISLNVLDAEVLVSGFAGSRLVLAQFSDCDINFAASAFYAARIGMVMLYGDSMATISGNSTFQSSASLESISLPNLITISGSNTFSYCNILESVSLPNLETISGGSTFSYCNILESVSLPNLETISNSSTFQNCTSLKSVSMPNVVNISYSSTFTNCTKLIDLTIGAAMNANFLLNTWSPTEALLTNSQSLLTPADIAAGFTNNREKLLYNIREHIAANLPDRTGLSSLTLTMSANIKAAINGDTATANAFANKNWIIA